MNVGEARDVPLSPRLELRRCLLEATDVLVEKIRTRHRRLTDLVDRFGDFCRPRVLFEANASQLGVLVEEFSKEYSDDMCREEMM